MGRFIKAVQAGEVIGPLRSGFKSKDWRAEHVRLGDDNDDENLLDAGILIHEKANQIRSRLRVTFSRELRATTKVRAFAALANYNHSVLRIKTQEAFQQIAEEQKASRPDSPVMMHELAAVKLKLIVGAKFSPDEIIQSMVDGMEIPLKRILEQDPDLAGNSEFGKLSWDDVRLDFNLGSLYSHIEGLWDDCLWNGYKTTRDGMMVKFSPCDALWLTRSTISRVRLDSLSREFAVQSQHIQTQLRYKRLLHTLGPLNVKGLSKEGRRQKIRLAHFESESSEGLRLLTMRAHASEPYYSELLNEPQPKLMGATLNQLLTAWTVVSGASNLLEEETDRLEVKKPLEPHTWLPSYASVLQTEALRRAISVACNCPFEQSEALVEFFIFRGKLDQELWAQPLLPTSKEGVVPLFATTRSPNLRRLVDVWLKQLGVDLGARGPAFEAHLRESIRRDIALSPILRNSAICLDKGVKFTPSNEREEEIDVVALVGDVVMIGEAKCFLEPAEPKQIAMHRVKVIDAVEQVKRKAAAVNRNKSEFRRRVSQLGLELPEKFSVLPVVIMNSAMHCGIAVDSVPIVDEYILGVFFRGEFVEVAVSDANGSIRPVRKRFLYTSPEEASQTLEDYLLSPPQIEPLLAGLDRRWVPVPAVNEEDWAGLFLALDCIPRVAPPTEAEHTDAAQRYSSGS